MTELHEHIEAPSGAFCISGPLKAIPRQGGGLTIVGAKGGKGGGSVRQPVETPDSLHSTSFAKVLDLISEGPIHGPVHGQDGLLRDIYLDGTPMQNADGTCNFPSAQADWRPGTQDQEHVGGFPESESTTGVNVELTGAQPWLRQITNRELSAVRVTLETRGLSKANTSNGDINGYRVEYMIDVQTDGGAWQEVLRSAFDGKTTSTYARTHRIDLPRASSGWFLRVTRLTPNANSGTIADTTYVQAFTEVVDARLRMPMSALMGVQVDAAAFQSIPQRAYHLRGRILAVPGNYDPSTRTYSGVWDGAFKQAWTDNPAWVFYDLVSNPRYGLGAFIPAGKLSMLKWALYPIAQYCDERVPDGFGNQEPRFACNAYLQQQGDAYRVLADLASVFRGMVYEQGGAVMASADIPGEPAYTYSAANVVDGRFSYSGTPRRTRYTVAQVSWNDMADMGRAKMEAVEDTAGQARYGLNITQVTAFGCASRGQAVRAAKWALLTSQRETQGVTFRVGLDHAVVAPGKIIRIVDPNRAGRRIGGRINSATRSGVTTDFSVMVRPGDRLVVNLPSGVSESRIIGGVVGEGLSADGTTWRADSSELTADLVGLPGATLDITVTPPFSELPEPDAVWTVESGQLTSQLYRILTISRKDGAMEAEISAVAHEPGKFANVDYGTKIDTRPISVVPPSVQPAPTEVTLSSYSVVEQGMAQHNAVIQWPQVSGAVVYQVQWRRDNSDWIEGGRTSSSRLELQNIRAGSYIARVRALNAANIPSAWTVSMETQLTGTIAPPPSVTSLTAKSLVFGIQLDWGFPTGPSIIERSQVWYSQNDDREQATLLGEFAYPQSTHTLFGLAAGARLYFWVRLIDKQGEIGPWYPERSGTLGMASADADEILEYLKGEITETELAQDLLTRIDNTSPAQIQINQIATEMAALYTLRTQLSVNGDRYLAGIAVGVEKDENKIISQILLAAERVAILDESSGSVMTPFVVQNGQVFMNQALIGTGWIKNAHIDNAAITNAKIADAAITSAKIQDASITSAKIQNASITSAKIGTASIDTLHLADGAVTTGNATGFSLNYWGQGSGTSSASLTFPIKNSNSNAVCVFSATLPPAQWNQQGGGDGGYTLVYVPGGTYRLLLDGNALTDWIDGSSFTSQSLALTGLSAGTHTFTVEGNRDRPNAWGGRLAVLSFAR